MDAKEFRSACLEAAANGNCARHNGCGGNCHHRQFKCDWETERTYCNDRKRTGPCDNDMCDWSVLIADGDEDCPIYQAYMVGKYQDIRLRTEYKVMTSKPFRDTELLHPMTLEREYHKDGLHEAEHWEYLNSVNDNFGY